MIAAGEQRAVMVDFLTAEVPDPVGIPVNAGEITRVDRDGEVEWSTKARLMVRGSWSSSMSFRAIGAAPFDQGDHRARMEALDVARMQVSGNPAKFLNGHNLFGTDDVAGLLAASIRKAKDAIWPDLFEQPEIDVSEALLSRIDLTSSWLLDREEDVLPTMRAMEETVWCPYRGRGVFDAGGSTLYFGRVDKGKRAKDWALKLYWKGPEITAHPLPAPAYSVPGLLDEVNRTIRCELTLRTPELKRLGLTKVGQWTAARVRQVWEEYVNKLDFGQATVNLDTVDLRSLGLKPRHIAWIAAWKAGNDLQGSMSKSAFYRLRKEIKQATGYDVAALCPKSNVVPLRRIVTMTPALHPSWADDLTAALSEAA